MTMLPANCAAISKQTGPAPVARLERMLRALSLVTMVMTVPQVLTIWIDGNAAGVSIVLWSAYLLSACLWLVYGLQKHDKAIYLACLGWIALDVAIVASVIVQA
jgi:uncharacterized protein with PQ loop repeat